MFKFKTLIVATTVIMISQDVSAQHQRPVHPPLPPGLHYDTLRRKDANNWEFVQVKMPGNPQDMGNQLISEGNYHNGVIEGTWIDYWETGAPHTIASFTNGKRNGISISMDPTGGFEKLENFKDDLLEGPSREYTPHSGTLLEECYYSQGLKHGRYAKWYSNRAIQEEAKYVNGKLEGTATWYYEDGKKSVEYSYHNGSLEGTATVYYRDGIASEMGSYTNNTQNGHWKEFNENGSIKAEGDYVNGEKEGTWKEYDILGQNPKTVKYKPGKEKK